MKHALSFLIPAFWLSGAAACERADPSHGAVILYMAVTLAILIGILIRYTDFDNE